MKVTSCAICGSDLHLYDGYIRGMENGDVMDHEFMGEVGELGAEVNGCAEGRRPGGSALHHHLRGMRAVAQQIEHLREADAPRRRSHGTNASQPRWWR